VCSVQLVTGSCMTSDSQMLINKWPQLDRDHSQWIHSTTAVYIYIHTVYTHSLVLSPRSRSGRSQSPVMEPIWLLAHCILGKFLGVVCHCFPPPLDAPTFAATYLCVRSDARDPSSERWNCGRERCPVVIPTST